MTLDGVRKTKQRADFNSHPHEEDDVTKCADFLYTLYFNSHPHEEDDPKPLRLPPKSFLFQLTSSRRG